MQMVGDHHHQHHHHHRHEHHYDPHHYHHHHHNFCNQSHQHNLQMTCVISAYLSHIAIFIIFILIIIAIITCLSVINVICIKTKSHVCQILTSAHLILLVLDLLIMCYCCFHCDCHHLPECHQCHLLKRDLSLLSSRFLQTHVSSIILISMPHHCHFHHKNL